jgi:energy-coupling factor transporter ATP-binding protein EcfA2
MLTRLYVTNYRCLVNFEFKPTNKQLIIGRNGVGKTTVFDVLALLRDIAVRDLLLERNLGGDTRTRWQDVAEQRFELDVKGNGGEYRYALVVAEVGRPPYPLVKQETLDFNGMPLFRFQEGKISQFDDNHKPTPSAPFDFPRGRSGLVTVESERKDSTKLAWFKRWLGRLQQVQINPWAMSPRSEHESSKLAKDMSNFADWYRDLLLEGSNVVFEAKKMLFEDIPGLEAFDLKEAGLGVRVLQAAMHSPTGKTINLPFSDLSEGQRALIALYVLLYCAVAEDRTMLIDEPDNFIALAEIQPWLMKLLDRVDETGGQVILVSHHPELLDQLADQGGKLFERPGGRETLVRPFEPPGDSGLRASEIIARGWESA